MQEYTRVFKTVEAYREFGHHMSICSHYPVHTQQLGSRYRINIHGHLHDEYIRDSRYINVCWDANLRPVAWDEIVDYYESVVKKAKNFDSEVNAFKNFINPWFKNIIVK